MYIYIYIYVYVCIYIYIHIHIHMYTYMHMHVLPYTIACRVPGRLASARALFGRGDDTSTVGNTHRDQIA